MTANDTVRSLYDAFAAGDGGALSTLLAETHWVEARGGPYGGVYQGFGEIAENVFGPIGRNVREFTAVPDELMSIGDDRVLALGRYRGTTDVGPLDIRFAHLWTVADNRITHFEQFTDTQEWRAAVEA
jgi:ketosteroid isomerase-like protein